GPTSSLRIIAGERIPHEASPASIPQRHVAGDSAGESPDMSPGKRAIVVVLFDLMVLAMLLPERAIRFKNNDNINGRFTRLD
ncbi:hypothetical protein Tco_0980015, partial [Tanacetum coccineum]